MRLYLEYCAGPLGVHNFIGSVGVRMGSAGAPYLGPRDLLKSQHCSSPARAAKSSRKGSAGTGRGYLAFVTKDYRDDTYYWCVFVFFKDLLIIASAAWFWSGVEQQVFSGTLSFAYTFLWRWCCRTQSDPRTMPTC